MSVRRSQSQQMKQARSLPVSRHLINIAWSVTRAAAIFLIPQKRCTRKIWKLTISKALRDIVKLIRNPGPQMTSFDKNVIPDNLAKQIAEYVLSTFK